MTSPWGVRRATASDIDLVTSIITLAFAHDPLWAHALARPDGRTAHHAEFWRLFAAVELARVSRPLSAAVSFVVSFTPVRGRSPVFARIVFVQFADGPEPR